MTVRAARADKQKTNKRRTMNEQKTVRTVRADREKTKEGWGYVEVKRRFKLR